MIYPKEALKYLPVSDLYPHPDNPRKDTGDVSELAASIRVNGVLQNLTVVPGHTMSRNEWVQMNKAEGVPAYVAQESYNRENAKCSTGYTVVIGHRRLAAAREAGLTELPCIISDMSEQEQYETMLIENMQRSDLTPLEEADGMQMMIDNWGATVSSISDATGLSESTVRRRLNIGKLDRKKTEKGLQRGATLQDYMALDQIRDTKKKEKVLESIGTADFNQQLQAAKKDQEFLEYMEAARKELEDASWAAEIQMDYTAARRKYDYDTEISIYRRVKNPLEKYRQLAGAGKKIFYQLHYDTEAGTARKIEIFLEKKKEKEDLGRNRLEELKSKVQADLNGIQQELDFKAQEYQDLREDFIDNFNKFGLFREEIQAMAVKTMLTALDWKTGKKKINFLYDPEIDVIALADALKLQYDEEECCIDQKELGKELFTSPEKVLLRLSYDLMETLTDGDNYDRMWEVDARSYRPIYRRNKVMEQLYQMLADLGYEISKEEEAYLQGACMQFHEAAAIMDEFLQDAKALKNG